MATMKIAKTDPLEEVADFLLSALAPEALGSPDPYVVTAPSRRYKMHLNIHAAPLDFQRDWDAYMRASRNVWD